MEAQALLLVIAAIAVIVLAAMLFNQKSKIKIALDSIEKDRKSLIEKEKILAKEAKIKELEELQNDREKLIDALRVLVLQKKDEDAQQDQDTTEG